MSILKDQFRGRSKTFINSASLVLVLLTGLVDFYTGYGIYFSAFYLLPVALAAWYAGMISGVVVSVLCVSAWLLGDYAAGVHYASIAIPIWNGFVALMVDLVVVKTLVSLRKLYGELETRVQQRTTALAGEMEERKRLEKELMEISERGQRHISHDLHDTLGQHLTATAFASQVLTQQLESKKLPEALSARHLVNLVEDAIRLTRTLARGLQPVQMEPQGLMNGFQELARLTSELFKVSCEFECREPVLLEDTETSTQLYRIAQEAITNAVKHGKARVINVSLEKNLTETILTITDDGVGLDVGRRDMQGMGLRIMAYRADMIGASFEIERMPDSGTRVTCKLPADKNQPVKKHELKN